MAIRNYALTDAERLTDGDAVYVRVKAGAALTAGQALSVSNGVATADQDGTYFTEKNVAAGEIFWMRYPQGSAQPSPPPANTALPTISGTPTVGQTLTAANGTWTGSPTSYTYQWLRDGTAISGATAQTYALVADDATTSISVTVTAHNAFGATPATSATVGPVAAA